MRISILGSRGIPASYGAFEVCAEKVGEGLVQRDCKVAVYCPRNQAYQDSSYKGMDLVYTYHPPGGLGSLVYDVVCLLKASFLPSDVLLVLGHSSSPFCLFPRLMGKKVVINTDGLEWKRSKWGKLPRLWLQFTERVSTKTANQLVSDSTGIADYFQEKYGKESVYIPYGTEFPELDPEIVSYSSQSSYYLVVMRMEPENRILEIVQGFSQSDTTKELVIVGPSTPFFGGEVLPLVEEDSRIKYLGPIYDREQLFRLRIGSFAYIHGHTVGGTNPSLLESLASRNLVIASDVPFNREVLGDAGFYFSTREDLVSCLEEVESLEDWRRKSRTEWLYERVSLYYTWDKVTDSYYELLCKLSK